MWVRVLAYESGLAITNASFSRAFANYGNGWYWVVVGTNTTFYVSASGRYGAYINSDYYATYYQWLKKVSSSGGGGNCWS